MGTSSVVAIAAAFNEAFIASVNLVDMEASPLVATARGFAPAATRLTL